MSFGEDQMKFVPKQAKDMFTTKSKMVKKESGWIGALHFTAILYPVNY